MDRKFLGCCWSGLAYIAAVSRHFLSQYLLLRQKMCYYCRNTPIATFFAMHINKTTLQKLDFKTIILKILEEKNEVSSRDIMQAVGLDISSSAGRRAIQRTFARLLQEQVIIAQGNARARVYSLKNKTHRFPPTDRFKNITLSDASLKILHYLEKPVQTRKIVVYNPDFLRSYVPNKTFYLSHMLRKDLFLTGIGVKSEILNS